MTFGMTFDFLAILAQAKLDPTTWVAYVVAALAVVYILIRPRLKKKDPFRGGSTT